MPLLSFPQRFARQQASPSLCCWCSMPMRRLPTADADGFEPWMCWNDQPVAGQTQSCWERQVKFAIAKSARQRDGKRQANSPFDYLFAPTPRQTEFAEQTRQTKYTLFGGAKAVTKSYGLRWLLYRDCLRIPNLRCLLLRRTFGELESTHLLEMPQEADRLDAVGARYKSAMREFSFGNGSLIRAGHCETDVDVAKFLSTQWDRIVFDEVVTFPLSMFLAIISCARSAKQVVIDEGGAQVWGGTNPGGRGAAWVYDFFVAHTPDREQFPAYDETQWGFVQGRLDDNPYVEPAYRQTLMNLPPILRRQWLDGDWHAFEGQFFDFEAQRNALPWHVADCGIAA
jgi:hypothetical protein